MGRQKASSTRKASSVLPRTVVPLPMVILKVLSRSCLARTQTDCSVYTSSMRSQVTSSAKLALALSMVLLPKILLVSAWHTQQSPRWSRAQHKRQRSERPSAVEKVTGALLISPDQIQLGSIFNLVSCCIPCKRPQLPHRFEWHHTEYL